MDRIYYYIRTPDGKEFRAYECFLIQKFEDNTVIQETEISTTQFEHAEFVGDLIVGNKFFDK